MKRYVSLEDISDGHLYTSEDLVKAGCGDCKGCSDCCKSMADTIILDPLDAFRLTTGLSCTFEVLLTDRLELGVVDGIILPHMKMSGAPACCSFLNEEGRCTIHDIRPGFCRLFPLGRYYEDRSFRYFLQNHECKKTVRTKVRVRKWIDTPDLKRNEKFIIDWHYFLKDVTARLGEQNGEQYQKMIDLYILKSFYQEEWEKDRDFYEQFDERLTKAKEILKISG